MLDKIQEILQENVDLKEEKKLFDNVKKYIGLFAKHLNNDGEDAIVDGEEVFLADAMGEVWDQLDDCSKELLNELSRSVLKYAGEE